MAVQAQYPSIPSRRNAYLNNNNNNNNSVLENFHQDYHLQYGHHHHHQEVLFKKGTVLSDPESELTCNFVSASTTTRKRKTTREDDEMLHQQLNPQHDRLNQSGGASTSGRRRIRRSSRYHDEDELDAVLLAVSSPQPLPHHHSQQYLLNSSYYFLHQNLDDEIEALIRLQNETLRSVVEQTQQRQCRLLMSVLEQQVERRLKQKQVELENAWSRNAELEEKVKQMSSEHQMWFNVAKNNEAMVLSLRSTLEQHLLNHQNTTMVGGLVEEGFGDSSDIGVAHDAQSSNNNNCHQLLQVNVGEREYKTVSSSNVDVRDHDDDDASMMMKQHQQQHRKMCKVCKEMEVSVLLLPCRHLCLCKDCEAKLQTCPICNSLKNASLQIFMS